METDSVETLLTIAVILLSVIIVALLTVITIVLLKVRKIAANVNKVTDNLAQASAWLTPAKIVHTISSKFRK